MNQPSKTKSIEESIGSLDSVNETNNGFIATLSQSAPNSLIHSESILTTMAKTTDASINGTGAAQTHSQPH